MQFKSAIKNMANLILCLKNAMWREPLHRIKRHRPKRDLNLNNACIFQETNMHTGKHAYVALRVKWANMHTWL